MSQEKFKTSIISQVIQNSRKLWNLDFFRNIFVNNWLKHFVLGSSNAEFYFLPCYSKKKINCCVFYKLEAFMWKVKNKCPATFVQQCSLIHEHTSCLKFEYIGIFLKPYTILHGEKQFEKFYSTFEQSWDTWRRNIVIEGRYNSSFSNI